MPETQTSAKWDRIEIRELIDNWAVWRDSGDWERFRTVWHEDGYMTATWFQGSASEFIRVSKEGFEKGVSILHFLGGTSIDLQGDRAIAQTKMTISQRAIVHDVLVEVLCTGRFYDFIEKRNGKWGLVLRRLCYEKDRMDVVNPGHSVELDEKILEQFPVGYRYLGYLQSSLGFKVKPNLPGLKGPVTDQLYEHGRVWLAGGSLDAAKEV